jgi:nitroreductase
LILSRRSVRDNFLDQPISDEVIAEIVRCGLAAPASKNAHPCRLHVVTDRAVLQTLAKAVASADGADTYVPVDPATGLGRFDWPSTVAESAQTLSVVPLAIFVENLGPFSGGRENLAGVPRENLRDCLVTYTLEVIGVGAAIMNMWLAAKSHGAQAAFMGDICVAEKVIVETLGIERDLVGVLAIGFSTSPPPPRRSHQDLTNDSLVVWRHRQRGPAGR